MLIAERLDRWASQRGSRPALIERGRTLTWAEVRTRVEALAADLLDHGLHPGDRVGLCLRESADFLLTALALQWAGIVMVPLDWRSKPAERQQLLRDFRIVRALVGPGIRAAESTLPWPPAEQTGRQADPHSSTPDAPAVIVLSSGTTGSPSGAVVACSAFEARLTTMRGRPQVFEDARHLSCTPLCFSMGLTEALRHLVFGNTVIVQGPLFTVDELVRNVADTAASHLAITPTIARWLLARAPESQASLATLRSVVLGGSALAPREKLAVAQSICPYVVEVYGSAATGTIAVSEIDDATRHPGSVGRLLHDVEARIVDAAGAPVAAGATGTLHLRGPRVASALITAEGEAGLADGWYSPGDLGRLDDDRFLYLEGRATDVIIRGGINVYPDYVERALRAHSAVTDVAVVPGPAAELGESVVAFVQACGPTSAAELLAHCRQQLSPKYVPDEIRFVDDFPRTSSGKILRRDLRQRMTKES